MIPTDQQAAQGVLRPLAYLTRSKYTGFAAFAFAFNWLQISVQEDCVCVCVCVCVCALYSSVVCFVTVTQKIFT